MLRRRSLFIACLTSAIALCLLLGNLTMRPLPGLARQLGTYPTAQRMTTAQWQPVEQAMGKDGTIQPGDVLRFSFPRSDLQVTVGDVQIKPALALGSWAAFKQMGNEAMVMGDLVLTQEEVPAVMSKLQENGIEQTALHHHLLYESPRIMYMHIGGQGNAVKMAKAIRAAIALTDTPLNAPASSSQSQDLAIDTAQLNQIMGYEGKVNGGVYQFSIPRAERITENRMEIPPAMGTATAINFQPTGDGKAAITGDFVLTANEVNPVIQTLRSNDIVVTSLHNHMLNDEPRLFFMHFWANDDAQKLARGLREALDKTNIAKQR